MYRSGNLLCYIVVYVSALLFIALNGALCCEYKFTISGSSHPLVQTSVTPETISYSLQNLLCSKPPSRCASNGSFQLTFISLSYLKDILSRYRILIRLFFFFSVIQRFLSFLSYIVSDKESFIIIIFVLLYVMSLFSANFNVFLYHKHNSRYRSMLNFIFKCYKLFKRK